jgi:hypothetical protein
MDRQRRAFLKSLFALPLLNRGLSLAPSKRVGGKSWLDIELPFTVNRAMAQRIADLELRRFNMAGNTSCGFFIPHNFSKELLEAGKYFQRAAKPVRRETEEPSGSR